MRPDTSQRGFSFFELMIAVAVVGIVSAVSIPAYKGYIDTANMTKVTATFEESVRMVSATFTRRKTRVTLGLTTNVPDTTEGWILLLNKNGIEAPGGGPAFIPSTNKTGEKGDALTGAIGVRWKKANKKKPDRIDLWRPLYSDLTGQRAYITEDDLVITKFKK